MSIKLEAAKRQIEDIHSDALDMSSAIQNEILATRTDIARLVASVRTTLKAPIDKFYGSAGASPDDLVTMLKRWGFPGDAEEALRRNRLKQDEPRRLAAAQEYTAASMAHENLRQVLKGMTEQHRSDDRTQDVERQIARIFNKGSWLQLPELQPDNYQSPWRRLVSPAYREIINILTDYRASGSSFFEDRKGIVARQYAYAELEERVYKAEQVAATAEAEHKKCVAMRSSWMSDAEFITANLRPLIDYLEIKDPVPKRLLDEMAKDIPEIIQAAEQSAKYRAQAIILQRQLDSLKAALPKAQSWMQAISPIRTKIGRIRTGDRNFKGIDLAAPRASVSAAKEKTHAYVQNLRTRRSESVRISTTTPPSSYTSHNVQDTGCSDFWLIYWLTQNNQSVFYTGPAGLIDAKTTDSGTAALNALGLDDGISAGQISTPQFDNTPTFDSADFGSALSGFEEALKTSCGGASTPSSCGSNSNSSSSSSSSSSCGSSSSSSSCGSSSSSSSCGSSSSSSSSSSCGSSSSSSSSSSCGSSSSSSGSSCGGGGGD
jgi:hypothetical protein